MPSLDFSYEYSSFKLHVASFSQPPAHADMSQVSVFSLLNFFVFGTSIFRVDGLSSSVPEAAMHTPVLYYTVLSMTAWQYDDLHRDEQIK